MDIIEWDESYSVGVEELDEQHKQLFNLLNALFEAEETSAESQTVSDLLAGMKAYAAMHFETEERYMSECEYADLASHAWVHELYRKKADKLCSDQMDGREGVFPEMLRFLYEWLVVHILSCDKDYAPFIRGHQADKSRRQHTTAS
ncbi:MAG: hemerythrin family protein [Phycisphaerae bacterium]|nr:hemerythrin family protein [Phycisphaerae bacterium]